jgi:hypothetical protein
MVSRRIYSARPEPRPSGPPAAVQIADPVAIGRRQGRPSRVCVVRPGPRCRSVVRAVRRHVKCRREEIPRSPSTPRIGRPVPLPQPPPATLRYHCCAADLPAPLRYAVPAPLRTSPHVNVRAFVHRNETLSLVAPVPCTHPLQYSDPPPERSAVHPSCASPTVAQRSRNGSASARNASGTSASGQRTTTRGGAARTALQQPIMCPLA